MRICYRLSASKKGCLRWGVTRDADKSDTWGDLQTMLPNKIVQQLLGNTFTCLDMICGGNFISFPPGSKMDQDLNVFFAQVHVLMSMMEFSVATWRILDSVHLEAVNDSVKLLQQMMTQIMKVMRSSARTRAPNLWSLSYDYPDKGYENIEDEFMMGDNILVAPVRK